MELESAHNLKCDSMFALDAVQTNTTDPQGMSSSPRPFFELEFSRSVFTEICK